MALTGKKKIKIKGGRKAAASDGSRGSSARASAPSGTVIAAPRYVERPLTTPAMRYLAARINPFSSIADGARVLDEYAFPTSVRRVQFKFNLTTDSSGNAGVCFLPNLSDVSAFVGGTSRSAGGSFTGTTVAYTTPVVDTTSLDAVMTAHRIVGWGVKVSWTQNLTAIQGTYTVGSVPCLAEGNFAAALAESVNTGDRAEDIYKTLGVPYVGSTNAAYLDVTSLSALPYAVVSQPLIKGDDVYMISKPTSAASTFFRNSATRKPGNHAFDAQTYSSTDGARDNSWMSKHGWQMFALGVTNATASANIAEISMVFHIEGIPKVSTGAIRDAAIEISPVAKEEMNVVDSVSAQIPPSMTGDDGRMHKVLTFAHNHASALKTGVSTLAGVGALAATRNPRAAIKAAGAVRSGLDAASGLGYAISPVSGRTGSYGTKSGLYIGM